MKQIFFYSIFLIVTFSITSACGGGSGTAAVQTSASDAGSSTESGLSLLPGSINSFQPLDIDE